MSLYNLRSADGDWAITKFDNDLNPLNRYLVSTEACECPAGHRPTCRHRQMLPRMLAAQIEDSGSFYDFDHDQFLCSNSSSPEIIEAEVAADVETTIREFNPPEEDISTALPTKSPANPAHPQGSIRRRL